MYINLKQFNFYYCLIALLLLGNSLSAQVLKGKVTDSLRQPISYANVIAKLKASNTIVAFTATDKDGLYQLNFKKKGNYTIIYSALSYRTDSLGLDFDIAKELNQDIILREEITELNEVIIQNERPITIKKDTIIYNISAFLKGNETVVEDVLKNLPGITVEADGTVKVGQQEVEKIMVEGDDFFKKGYKLLSKNLNADVIDNVEIYQKYSNNRLLKGIEDSNKVAINLTLKEDRNVNWFGNTSITLGYGSNYLYAGNANLMRFGKKAKHYFLANANNIGEPSGGESVFYADVTSIKDIGTIGDGEFSNKLINLEGFNIAVERNRYNFNSAEMLSFNSIFKISKKAKLKTNILLDWDETEFQQSNIQNFTAGAQTFTNTEESQLVNNRFKFYTELDFDYDISKTKSLEIDTKYTQQQNDVTNQFSFNDNQNNENLAENNRRLDHKMIFTNKLTDKTALIYSGRYIFEELPQNYNIDNFLAADLFPTINANNTQQVVNNKINVLGVEAHLIKRTKSKNLLEVKAGFSYRNDDLISNLVLSNDSQSNQPSLYANDLRYNVGDLYALSKYKFVFGKLSIIPKLELHQINNSKNSFNTQVSQSVFYINPDLVFGYKINESNSLGLSLSNTVTNATLINVFDNYVLQNFRTFYRGTSNFDQIEASSINFKYSLGDWSSSFFANLNVGYIKNHDFFSTNSSIEQNFSQIDAIVIEDREQWIAGLKLDQYLDFMSTNLKVNLQYTQSEFKNRVNSLDLRTVENTTYVYGFELRSAFDGIFNYNLGNTWQTNTIKTTTDFTNTNTISFVNLNFNYKKLNVDLNTERYNYGNLETDDTYYFFDIVSKYNFKKKGLTLTLKGLNLFNIDSFREVFISDVSSAVREYRLLPRFILLGIDFRF